MRRFTLGRRVRTHARGPQVKTPTLTPNALEPPNHTATLNAMIDALRHAPMETLPSKYWTHLNQLNVQQLADSGFENFKRTIAMNYFTWVVSPRHEQVKYLLRHVPPHAIPRAIAKALTAGFHPPLSPKRSLYYNLHTYLLWLYVAKRADSRLLNALEEPDEGNPPSLYWGGRKISQDLANSILEFSSIVGSGVNVAEIRTVMELGAGYGRTGYVFERLLPSIKYVVVDIPPALYISQRYLSSQFPEKRVFPFRPFENYAEIKEEYERAQIAFLLPQQLDALPAASVDLFVNISSFHEMRPEQIRYYFRHVQRLTRGYLYLKQWKTTRIPYDDIVLDEHDYPVPPSWQRIFWRDCAVQTSFFEALLKVAPSTCAA
jgi:putative sugar O-methyltransferase